MRVRDVLISICEEWFRTFSGAMDHSMQVYYYMLRDAQVNVMEGGIKETDSRIEQGRGQRRQTDIANIRASTMLSDEAEATLTLSRQRCPKASQTVCYRRGAV